MAAAIERSDLELVPINPGDTAFLMALYLVSRDFEMEMNPWPEADKRAFLEWQFSLQHRHYQTHYAGADFDLVLLKGVRVGRIYVHRQKHDIRLMDITLLREHRNRGIGSRLIRELLDEGTRLSTRVSLHVEPANPAMRLYRRLDFRVKRTEGAYHYMEWLPDGGSAGGDA